MKPLVPIRRFLSKMMEVRKVLATPLTSLRGGKTSAVRMRNARLRRNLRKYHMEGNGDLFARVDTMASGQIVHTTFLPVPSIISEVVETIERLHTSEIVGGHCGRDALEKKLKRTIYVRGARALIRSVIRGCNECNDKAFNDRLQSSRSLKPILVTRPLQRIVYDHVHMPHVDPDTGNKYILMLIDKNSRYLWAHSFPNRSAGNVRAALTQILRLASFHGEVKETQCDNAKEFWGEVMVHLLSSMNIRGIAIHAHRPQEDGAIERANESLEAMITAYGADKPGRTWTELIQDIVGLHNDTVCRATGRTPAELLFGRLPSFRGASSVAARADPPEPYTPEALALVRAEANRRDFAQSMKEVRRKERRRRPAPFRKAPDIGGFVKVVPPKYRFCDGRTKVLRRTFGRDFRVAKVIGFEMGTHRAILEWYSHGYRGEPPKTVLEESYDEWLLEEVTEPMAKQRAEAVAKAYAEDPCGTAAGTLNSGSQSEMVVPPTVVIEHEPIDVEDAASVPDVDSCSAVVAVPSPSVMRAAAEEDDVFGVERSESPVSSAVSSTVPQRDGSLRILRRASASTSAESAPTQSVEGTCAVAEESSRKAASADSVSSSKIHSTPIRFLPDGASGVYKFETILGKSRVRGHWKYLVKWEGYDVDASSWLSVRSFANPDFILEDLPLKLLDADDDLPEYQPLYEMRLSEDQQRSEAIIPPVSLPFLRSVNGVAGFLDCSVAILWSLRRGCVASLLDDSEFGESPPGDSILGLDRSLLPPECRVFPTARMVDKAALKNLQFHLAQTLRALDGDSPDIKRAECGRTAFWEELVRQQHLRAGQDTTASRAPFSIARRSESTIPGTFQRGGTAVEGLRRILRCLDQNSFADHWTSIVQPCGLCEDGTESTWESLDDEDYVHVDLSSSSNDVLSDLSAWMEEHMGFCSKHPRCRCKVRTSNSFGNPVRILVVFFDGNADTSRSNPLHHTDEDSVVLVRRKQQPAVEVGVLNETTYFPVGSLHACENGRSVAQIRVGVSGRPGKGLWYTYDPENGALSLNAHGLHDRSLRTLACAVFVREDLMSTARQSRPTPPIQVSSRESATSSVPDGQHTRECFPVHTFCLKTGEASCWLDTAIVAVFSALRQCHLNIETDGEVRRLHERAISRLRATWDSSLLGEDSSLRRDDLWKWMNGPDSTESWIADQYGVPPFGNEGNPTSILQMCVDASPRLAIECEDVNLPCEVPGCCESGRSVCRRDHIFSVDIPFLDDTESTRRTACLNDVVAAFFDGNSQNFLEKRPAAVVRDGPRVVQPQSKSRCTHTRHRYLRPTEREHNLPVIFLAYNDDLLKNKHRLEKMTYVVDDKPVGFPRSVVTYVPAAVVIEHPSHFSSQIRIHHPKGTLSWWTYDGIRNEGHLTHNPNGAFQPSENVKAIVFARFDMFGE